MDPGKDRKPTTSSSARTHAQESSGESEATLVSVDSPQGTISYRGFRGLWYFPTLPNDPLVPAYEGKLRPAILQLISARDDWCCLGVRQYGHTEKREDHHQKIMILVKNDKNKEWEDIEIKIRSLLDLAGWNHLELEIRMGKVARYADHEGYSQRRDSNLVVEAAKFGNMGKLGMWVCLTPSDSTVRTLGLACHHVVLYDPDPQGVTKHGLSPYKKSVAEFVIRQPTTVDHQASMVFNEESTASNEADLRAVQDEISTGITSRRNINLVASHSKILDVLREQHRYQASFDRMLGIAWASSGFGVSASALCSLDWSLIEVPSHKIGKNLAKPVGLLPGVDLRSDIFAVTQVGTVILGDKVTLTSGAGEALAGVHDAIKDDVLMPFNPRRTRELVIHCQGQDKQYFPLKKGLSGAAVTNQQREFVGMLIGGDDRGTGYVTPARVLFEDIERETGCTVSLPTLDDFAEE
ncbi:MAG: hypothetical protein M1817_005199 [Caeruleum heppii]|nr:MAG: hypothetical protein M1817_005199 [Caeruleum heppii]